MDTVKTPLSKENAFSLRIAYLWREVLNRDSLLDILARFLHLEVEETTLVTERA